MSAIRGISEIVMNVHSMVDARKFYEGVLGLVPISPPELQSPVFLQAGSHGGIPDMVVLVELPARSAAFAEPRSLHHLALEVAPEAFDAEKARLTGLGFIVRVGKHPIVPSRTMYLNDPDGNEVELICTA
jgi:catechol 2,3-dioxygenase-like lactoylglutathione lyase family enzyme